MLKRGYSGSEASSALSSRPGSQEERSRPPRLSRFSGTSDGDDDEEDEDGDGEGGIGGEESGAAYLDRLQKQIAERIQEMQFQRLVASRTPAVPSWPAPPAGPGREAYRGPLPAALILEEEEQDGQLREKTALDRMLNSSIGRCLTFSLTILLFGIAACGVVFWNTPTLRLGGEAFYVMAGSCTVVALLYTLVPKLAERTGMNPREAGWKPYFVIYRFAYLTALPALLLLSLGYGHQVAFGTEEEGSGGGLRVSDLRPSSFHYFEAADGFVALNLTKGIAQTLTYEQHGQEGLQRLSRFRDAQLRINREPFSNIPEPTTPPGLLKMYRIAPIFASKASCVSRYRTTVACLNENPVLAWAVSSTQSFCASFRVAACKNPEPVLKPVYRCTSANPVQGDGYVGDVQGLCGRVIEAPHSGVIQELKFLLEEEAWPLYTYPNSSTVWIDVSPDKCIGSTEDCQEQWSILGLVGVIFALLTFCFVAIPAVLDCIVDRWIRKARWMISMSERSAITTT